jgi:hypothetical protein
VDFHKSGAIEKDEYVRFLTKKGADPLKVGAFVSRLWSRVEKNEDGTVDVVDFMEAAQRVAEGGGEDPYVQSGLNEATELADDKQAAVAWLPSGTPSRFKQSYDEERRLKMQNGQEEKMFLDRVRRAKEQEDAAAAMSVMMIYPPPGEYESGDAEYDDAYVPGPIGDSTDGSGGMLSSVKPPSTDASPFASPDGLASFIAQSIERSFNTVMEPSSADDGSGGSAISGKKSPSGSVYSETEREIAELERQAQERVGLSYSIDSSTNDSYDHSGVRPRGRSDLELLAAYSDADLRDGNLPDNLLAQEKSTEGGRKYSAPVVVGLEAKAQNAILAAEAAIAATRAPPVERQAQLGRAAGLIAKKRAEQLQKRKDSAAASAAATKAKQSQPPPAPSEGEKVDAALRAHADSLNSKASAQLSSYQQWKAKKAAEQEVNATPAPALAAAPTQSPRTAALAAVGPTVIVGQDKLVLQRIISTHEQEQGQKQQTQTQERMRQQGEEQEAEEYNIYDGHDSDSIYDSDDEDDEDGGEDHPFANATGLTTGVSAQDADTDSDGTFYEEQGTKYFASGVAKAAAVKEAKLLAEQGHNPMQTGRTTSSETSREARTGGGRFSITDLVQQPALEGRIEIINDRYAGGVADAPKGSGSGFDKSDASSADTHAALVALATQHATASLDAVEKTWADARADNERVPLITDGAGEEKPFVSEAQLLAEAAANAEKQLLALADADLEGEERKQRAKAGQRKLSAVEVQVQIQKRKASVQLKALGGEERVRIERKGADIDAMHKLEAFVFVGERSRVCCEW